MRGGTPWTLCPCCLAPVMALRGPGGAHVMVDPTPRPGGVLFVNGAGGRVIATLPAHGPGSKEETCWWPHRAVCLRLFARPVAA